ncbi:septal ring lytic transglycosylase RlpA family protein [Hyphomicrobium sp.]|uniref:septal ring lytic transglycosylase RlpA family protein n=1 Tax=Hyphomicrobium sp. TaxID=82 RepID=UPI003F6E7542
MRTHSSGRRPRGARKIAGQVVFALTPALGALFFSGAAVEAKTPGKSYCYYGKCHRVKTLAETEALIGKDETVQASHYDSCKRDRYNPCGLTSSGEAFRHDEPDNAASPIYPDGTTVLAWAPATGASVVLRINNAGPYWGNRRLDVSIKAAEVLGFKGQGVATLKVRVIDAPTQEEATYKRNRTYPKVPGYIGTFASLDEAQSGAATAYMVAGLESPIPVAGLGAGNPTQLAGSIGTQSGAAPIVPTVLAAVAPDSADDAAKVASAAVAAKPVVLASLDVSEAPAASALKSVAPAPHKARAERVAQRNSRSYRVAQRKQNRQQPARVQQPAVVAEAPQGKRIVTQDGTNDMSVFTRHTYAGIDRLAPQEARRRQASFGGYGGGYDG